MDKTVYMLRPHPGSIRQKGIFQGRLYDDDDDYDDSTAAHHQHSLCDAASHSPALKSSCPARMWAGLTYPDISHCLRSYDVWRDRNMYIIILSLLYSHGHADSSPWTISLPPPLHDVEHFPFYHHHPPIYDIKRSTVNVVHTKLIEVDGLGSGIRISASFQVFALTAE